MRNTLRFLAALLAINLKASVALRGAFLVRAVFMVLNNLVFFVMWWVFFTEYEEVRGWRIADMAALFSVCAGAFGIAVVVGAGVREIARYVADGDLDSFLAQPKSPLLSAVASQSEAAGWGDAASGLLLFFLSGYADPISVLLWLVACLCGAVVFLASGVILQSMAFWLGDTRAISRQAWEFLITFSLYPKTIFGGFIRVFLYTVLPAGFCAHLPVELVRDFRFLDLLAVLGGAIGYSLLATFVFSRGLRRYESGNRFGVRA